MAFNHGKDLVIKVDDSGSTLRDISTYTTGVDFPRTVDTAETSTAGNASKTYVAGMKDATITIEGNYDSTVDGYLEGILGLTGSIEYGPAGSTAGYVKYSCEAICTAYNPPASVDDAAKWSASFQVTGDVTRGTWS